MNVKVLGNKVLIKPVQNEEKTAGGIYIPDAAKEKPQIGEIVSVGPGTDDYIMQTNIGDKVMHGKYAGTEVELENEKYIIIEENDLLLILGE